MFIILHLSMQNLICHRLTQVPASPWAVCTAGEPFSEKGAETFVLLSTFLLKKFAVVLGLLSCFQPTKMAQPKHSGILGTSPLSLTL